MPFRTFVHHDSLVLRTTMNSWLAVLESIKDRRIPCALVVLVQTTGSTPREVGAKMVVTASDYFGTIGGGALEYEVIEQARQMLRAEGNQQPKQCLQTWHLGADIGQCCGGACTLYLEILPPVDHFWLNHLMKCRDNEPCVLITSLDSQKGSDRQGKMIVTSHHVEGSLGAGQESVLRHARILLKLPINSDKNPHMMLRKPGDQSPAYFLELYGLNSFRLILFGAGHVGKAIIDVIGGLPCHVTWVDARPEMFPVSVPPNVEKEVTEQYVEIIQKTHPGTFFLIMTHSHPLDLELCEHILKRGDFKYLGLIGSKTKRTRFEKRLLQKGLRQEEIKRLICPIGIPEISGKYPGAIAISVVAQVLQQLNTTGAISEESPTMKSFITEESAYQYPKKR